MREAASGRQHGPSLALLPAPKGCHGRCDPPTLLRRAAEATAASLPEDSGEAQPSSLRFAVGARVRCSIGPSEWAAGRVVQLHYREPGWPPGRTVPYQVALDDGSGELIFAPSDEERVICAAPEEDSSGEVTAAFYY